MRDQAGAGYSYDRQNRLISLEMGGRTFTFVYDGLGNRFQQRVDGITSTYSLDLNLGLTQVLSDGTNAYLYGLGRIAEEQPSGWAYHLPDALGSVRQLANETGAAILAKAYQPFGSPLNAAGLATTSYGFTGEWTDATGLVHLRARYYQPQVGRFFQKDLWSGHQVQPATLHAYAYALDNPLSYGDPSGMITCRDSSDKECIRRVRILQSIAMYTKTSVAEGRILPVEALAQFVDYAMRLFDLDVRGMMWATTNVIVGYDPNRYVWAWVGPFGPPGNYFVGQNWLPYMNDPTKDDPTLDPEYTHSERGDWHPALWDDTPNQAFHFWYWVGVTFFDNVVMAIIGNRIHEGSYDVPRDMTIEDSNLSYMAMRLGMDLSQAVSFWRSILGDCPESSTHQYFNLNAINPGAWIRANLKG